MYGRKQYIQTQPNLVSDLTEGHYKKIKKVGVCVAFFDIFQSCLPLVHFLKQLLFMKDW